MRGRREGFTLTELLVVITVIAILSGISIRILKTGDAAVAHHLTVNRLLRLQNCLSGYFAAFGHYPAVPLHASRDFRLKANNYGIQTAVVDSTVTWRNIRAALLAQPVTVEFPFDVDAAEAKADVTTASKADISWAKGSKKTGDPTAVAVLLKGYKPLAEKFVSSRKAAESWSEVQLFRMGLLAYLLPRSEFMLKGESTYAENYAAWNAHNELSEYYDPETGEPVAASWAAIADAVRMGRGEIYSAISRSVSQSATARWMPNLAGTVRGGGVYYGIETGDGKAFREREEELRDAEASDLFIHAPGTAASPTSGSQYVLDGMTVLDGWESELYYYSPAPHRQCRIWSAGPDRKSFPPWVDTVAAARDSTLKEALSWTRDDIVTVLP